MTGSAPGWVDDDRLAAAAWSRLVEAEDAVGAAVLHALGAVEAVRHVVTGTALPGSPGPGRARLEAALHRWRVRLPDLDPERDVRAVQRLGGRVVLPSDPEWPPGLDDLGIERPACLWARGPLRLGPALARSVAMVGSRASTPYGETVAADLGADLASQGAGVVSGAAFGIDAAGHRGALSAAGTTVAVLACGVDRAYPLAHARLLERIAEEGLVVSEQAPGSAPMRHRFLSRNRLIAAMSGATVVVEAAWRSGALSTAMRAAGLGRPLGAVPGPVTSATSAGCHRLLREVGATCVTQAADVLELLVPLGQAPAGEPVVPPREHDELDPELQRVLEALPLRVGRPVESVARVAGLAPVAVISALGRLAALDLAERVTAEDGHRWRRRPPSRPRALEPRRPRTGTDGPS